MKNKDYKEPSEYYLRAYCGDGFIEERFYISTDMEAEQVADLMIGFANKVNGTVGQYELFNMTTKTKLVEF
jgi:hypothetical protein